MGTAVNPDAGAQPTSSPQTAADPRAADPQAWQEAWEEAQAFTGAWQEAGAAVAPPPLDGDARVFNRAEEGLEAPAPLPPDRPDFLHPRPAGSRRETATAEASRWGPPHEAAEGPAAAAPDADGWPEVGVVGPPRAEVDFREEADYEDAWPERATEVGAPADYEDARSELDADLATEDFREEQAARQGLGERETEEAAFAGAAAEAFWAEARRAEEVARAGSGGSGSSVLG